MSICSEHAELVDALVKPGVDILATVNPDDVHLWHMATGVAGEAGELIDAVKKAVVYRKALDRENMIEELGDLEFYLCAIRKVLGVTREEVLERNTSKLRKSTPTKQRKSVPTRPRLRWVKVRKFSDASHSEYDAVIGMAHFTVNSGGCWDVSVQHKGVSMLIDYGHCKSIALAIGACEKIAGHLLGETRCKRGLASKDVISIERKAGKSR